ncbi:MAG: D-alanine--D-alanine ligase [Deltaproteobacteria bacterium]|nr:D-alanine--D-alanine ligase [Deltaproteobacteria bacterium]
MTHVKLIYNDDSDEGQATSPQDIAAQASAVVAIEDALRSEGFPVSVIPLKTTDRATLDIVVREIKAGGGFIVFNLCEGVFGKSSLEMHVAALFELYGARFTGSGPLTLGLSLDKGLTKDVLRARGVPTADYCIMTDPSEVAERFNPGLKFPLIVKPLHEDASIGIGPGSVVKTVTELRERVVFVTREFNQPAIVEEYIDGREFNIAVFGNGAEARAFPASEIEFDDFPPGSPKICCYEAKWVEGSPFYKKTKPVCPANIPAELNDKLSAIALDAYAIMGCRDYARVDMRLGADGKIRVLEVNPNPDISPDAGFARAAKAAGMGYPKFIAEIVFAAQKRYGQIQAHNPATGGLHV